MRRIAVIAASLVALSLVAGVILASCSWILNPSDYRSGVDAARRDIAASNPRRAEIGQLIGGIDEETGLPMFSIGCGVTDKNLAYIDGYNAETRRALRAHEIDAYVLKSKLTTCEALGARFAAEGGGIELTMSSPPIDAPGGRYRIEIASRFGTAKSPYLYATDRWTGERKPLYFLGEPRAKVLFADGGTTLVVRDEALYRYFTVDIPRGVLVQLFEHPW